MSKRIRYKIGDIFLIELENGLKGRSNFEKGPSDYFHRTVQYETNKGKNGV